jgi:predicted dehydrogenase
MSAAVENHPVRWGLVAPGWIARKFARDLRVAEGGRLYAVAGRDSGRAREFAAEFGAERALDNVAELAADPKVDIVYVASPHSAHFEAASLLLEAGKAVLCEKPITVNAEQTRKLIELSRANGVLLMEAMWTRCLPVYSRVRAWLDEGRIGKPLLVSSAFCIRAPQDPGNRWFNPALAGGGLLDVGVYNMAISQFVMGRKPVEVSATAKFAETGVDELLSASLRYEHGGIAQFVCGLNATFDNALVIGGEKGFIRVPSCFMSAEEAALHVDGKIQIVREPLRGEGFEYEIEEAMRCHRAGAIESPLIPHADSLATMETMDEIRRMIGLRYPFEGTY